MGSKLAILICLFLSSFAACAQGREIRSVEEALRLGDQAVLNGQDPAAEVFYRRASALAPKLAAPTVRLGEILYAQSRYREALETFERASLLRKDAGTKKFLEFAIQKMNVMKPLLDRIEKAAESGDAALLDRLHTEAAERMARGVAFMALVGPHLETLLKNDPGNVKILRSLAEGYYASSDPAKAFGYYKKLSRSSRPDTVFYKRLGDVAVNVGDYDEARLSYKKALRAAVLAHDANQIRELKKMIRALPVFSSQIEAMILSEDHGGAFRELRKYLARNPSHPWAVVQMGRIYEAMGRLGQAENLYLQAIRWRYEEPNAHYALGRFYLLKKKKFEKALEEFKLFRVTLSESADLVTDEDQRKKMDGYLRDATRSIATIYLEVLREPKMAEAELENLVKSDDADARDHYSLGVAYLRNRKKTSAYQAFKKAIDIDPKSEAAKDAEEVIGTLRAASRKGFEVEA